MQPWTMLHVRSWLVRSGYFAATFAACLATLDAQSVELASRTLSGASGNDASRESAVSADGRKVAFRSFASDLIGGDTNQQPDVFVLDRQTGTLERANVSTAGAQCNAATSRPFLSGDGRFVVFTSEGTNLVAGDTNGVADTFLRDLTNSTTERVNISSAGAQADGLSHSARIAITADGRYVGFCSFASNLALGDTNGKADIYVRDRLSATTERVSVTSTGGEPNASCWSPAISADGRYVTYESDATNLVPGDTNGCMDVFRRDRSAGWVGLVSRGPGLALSNGDSFSAVLSADGRYMAFATEATNFGFVDTNFNVDLYVRDLVLGTLDPVTVATGGTQLLVGYAPAITPDARWVAFEGSGPSYDPQYGSSDGSCILVRDRANATTTWVSRNNCGVPADGTSESPALSADANVIAFHSYASLVVGDHNLREDAYVFDLTGTPPPIAPPSTYCTAKVNSVGCTPTITFSGTPSSTNPTPFIVGAVQVINQKTGLVFYGMDPLASPFSGGTLCVHPPIQRTALQSSGGNPPPNDCSGTYAYDFNALIQSGADPRLLPCREAFLQYWYRDPNDATGYTTGLTDAVRIQIQP